jgi:hypothetical protein
MANRAHVTQHRHARADAAVRAIGLAVVARARRKGPAVGLLSVESPPDKYACKNTKIMPAKRSKNNKDFTTKTPLDKKCQLYLETNHCIHLYNSLFTYTHA